MEEQLTITVDESLGDMHLPRSHTCFFAVDLPCYSSEEARQCIANLLAIAAILYCTVNILWLLLVLSFVSDVCVGPVRVRRLLWPLDYTLFPHRYCETSFSTLSDTAQPSTATPPRSIFLPPCSLHEFPPLFRLCSPAKHECGYKGLPSKIRA
jgi:hypothetical protein